uniref:Reverse transcriptase domain-containing protein n=1 Tax=Tanacetum cinerariifolium TaxID=118510 RepID=A0A699JLU4_TANCI|nr:hypothetical protein [Tanacetum cinerariifolium]
MSPRVMTRSAGRLVAESQRGGTNGLGANGSVEGVNRNVEGVNRRTPNFSMIISQQLQNLLPTMLALVGNQGNVGNQNGNVVNENVQENVENVIVNGKRVEFCPSHEMQKLESELWNYSMVGAGHVAYTDRYVYGLAPWIHGMVVATKSKTIQKAVQISGALTDEAVRNGSIRKEERIWVLGPSVPPATPTMHPEGLVAHASTGIHVRSIGSFLGFEHCDGHRAQRIRF